MFTSATPVGISVGKTLGLDETQIWRLAGVTYNSSMTSQARLGEDGELRLFSFNAVPHSGRSGNVELPSDVRLPVTPRHRATLYSPG
ncbi:MAG: hypothetical protein R2724_29575 [Bryobacterales bacterium]